MKRLTQSSKSRAGLIEVGLRRTKRTTSREAGDPSAKGCILDKLAVLLALGFITLLVIAAWRKVKRSAEELATSEKRRRKEAEEQFQIYQDAWAAARNSQNLETFINCGDYFVRATRSWQPRRLTEVSWDVYREFLKRLKTQPDMKPKVLEIGRAAYSARRFDGMLTVYDEQAIQNDILAHLE